MQTSNRQMNQINQIQRPQIQQMPQNDEDNIPLGMLIPELRKNKKSTLITIDELSVKKVQVDIWSKNWDDKVEKHKRQRRREQCIIDGDLY